MFSNSHHIDDLTVAFNDSFVVLKPSFLYWDIASADFYIHGVGGTVKTAENISFEEAIKELNECRLEGANVFILWEGCKEWQYVQAMSDKKAEEKVLKEKKAEFLSNYPELVYLHEDEQKPLWEALSKWGAVIRIEDDFYNNSDNDNARR